MIEHNNISPENQKYTYKSRCLPHLFDIDKAVFITFRLKFSIPRRMLQELEGRKNTWLQELSKLSETEQREQLNTKDIRLYQWFDELLNRSDETPHILQRDDVAEIVATTFHFHDNIRYQLLAYCIMPNHVHVLFLPKMQENGDVFSPQHIVYTWKRYSANSINKLLNQKGSVWQKESFDRMVRDENELYKVLEYIMLNPVQAKLVSDWRDWKRTFVCESLRPD